jgi:hypothetical protein
MSDDRIPNCILNTELKGSRERQELKVRKDLTEGRENMEGN